MRLFALTTVLALLSLPILAQSPLPDSRPKASPEKVVFGVISKVLELAKVPEDPEDEPGPDRVMVEVQPFTLRSKAFKRLEVTPTPYTHAFRLETASLEEIPKEAQLHVLGRLQEKQQVPGSSRKLPAQIINIAAVVEGVFFQPPPLNDEARDRKLQWFKGKLTKEGAREFKLDFTSMQIGPDRKVIRHDRGNLEKIRRADPVVIRGELGKSGKTVTCSPKSIVLLPRKALPKDERVHALGG